MSALNSQRLASTLSSVCKSCRPQPLSLRFQRRTLSTSPNSNASASMINNMLRQEGAKAKRAQDEDRKAALRAEGVSKSEAESWNALDSMNSKKDSINAYGFGMPKLPETKDLELPGLSPGATALSMYHFHIYSHKHNTHITLSKPNRDAIISVSCGNLGFKKAQRGTFDAAFQLAAYVLNRMNEDPKMMTDMQRVELVLKGFGPGREAVTKAIMGQEGINLRAKIVTVMDSTKLKFGGGRSRAIRRLG